MLCLRPGKGCGPLARLSRAYYVTERAKNPLRFDRDRHNAEKRGLAFELSRPRKRELQEQARNDKCEATGLPFDLNAEESRNPFFPSLDRIDNSKGYLDNNVRVVVRAFNLMRGDLEDRTFHRIIVGYVKERRRRRELAEKGTGPIHPSAGATTAEREQTERKREQLLAGVAAMAKAAI